MQGTNKGYDPKVIEEYRSKILSSGNSFLFDEADENSEEYVHFYFIGVHDNREVIFDAVLYSLRLYHENEIMEIAEERAAEQFPYFTMESLNELDNGESELTPEQQEEVGLFLAEVILELEEEDQVKVKEHFVEDASAEFGVALDAVLHVEEITPQVIKKFISEFNSNSLKLDPTLYSFQISTEGTAEED
ncbi:MAG: hypothetical protein OEU76_01160 [Cyclobacteriaceae bacterium]|nr:hypothetical protein [Cyclobacteriaceae bacterium]